MYKLNLIGAESCAEIHGSEVMVMTLMIPIFHPCLTRLSCVTKGFITVFGGIFTDLGGPVVLFLMPLSDKKWNISNILDLF